MHAFMFTLELYVLLFTFCEISAENKCHYKSVECKLYNCTGLKENMSLINMSISFKLAFASRKI